MMRQLAFTSQMYGRSKIEKPGVLVWAAGHQLASSAWLAGVVVLNCYHNFYMAPPVPPQWYRWYQTLQTHLWGSQELWDPSLWWWIVSSQYRVLALVFVLWWGFPPKELAGKVLSETRLFYQLLCVPDTGKASPRDTSSIPKSSSLWCCGTLQEDSELFRAALRKKMPLKRWVQTSKHTRNHLTMSWLRNCN